jgi:predicted SAM-dependent methyltransferase
VSIRDEETDAFKKWWGDSPAIVGKEHVRFEAWRAWSAAVAYTEARRRESQRLVKLNIACGPNAFPFDGWLNYDHVDFVPYFANLATAGSSQGMPPHQKKLCDYLMAGGDVGFRVHDMTQRFPHEDNSVDIIYVGQAIEHLNPVYQAPAFLKECWRMLAPGGILRMTTPDLDVLVRAYVEARMGAFVDDQPEFYKEADAGSRLAFLMFGASGPECTQERYEGHFFLFTQESMRRFLEAAGFRDIECTRKAGDSKSEMLRREVNDEGMGHSFVVECVK